MRKRQLPTLLGPSRRQRARRSRRMSTWYTLLEVTSFLVDAARRRLLLENVGGGSLETHTVIVDTARSVST